MLTADVCLQQVLVMISLLLQASKPSTRGSHAQDKNTFESLNSGVAEPPSALHHKVQLNCAALVGWTHKCRHPLHAQA